MKESRKLYNSNIFCQVMNAYMATFAFSNNTTSTDNVYVLPSYLAVLWDRDVYDHWLYAKV